MRFGEGGLEEVECLPLMALQAVAVAVAVVRLPPALRPHTHALSPPPRALEALSSNSPLLTGAVPSLSFLLALEGQEEEEGEGGQ